MNMSGARTKAALSMTGPPRSVTSPPYAYLPRMESSRRPKIDQGAGLLYTPADPDSRRGLNDRVRRGEQAYARPVSATLVGFLAARYRLDPRRADRASLRLHVRQSGLDPRRACTDLGRGC